MVLIREVVQEFPSQLSGTGALHQIVGMLAADVLFAVGAPGVLLHYQAMCRALQPHAVDGALCSSGQSAEGSAGVGAAGQLEVPL